MKTITLTPNFIEFRSNKKMVKFKITNDKAIELLMKWNLPMNAFLNFDTLNKEDQKWIVEECTRVLVERNKENNMTLVELVGL